MNNKVGINIAFTILLVFLFISGIKSLNASGMFDAGANCPTMGGLGGFSSMEDYTPVISKSKKKDSGIVLRDFDDIKINNQGSRSIDRGTASFYTKTRALTGTETLELGKIYKIGRYLNSDKKIVIYVNKGSDRDTQAFISEFSKVRSQYSGNSNYVFIPLDTLWDLSQTEAKNSHDRVVNNFKKDCGLVCIIDTKANTMTKMKGYNVNKKSAQIMGVMLK